MNDAIGLYYSLARAGFDLSAQNGSIVVKPAGKLTPAQRESIVAHKAALLDMLATHPRCPECKLILDERRRCWRCQLRLCPCGMNTGSPLIELCVKCGLEYRTRNLSEVTNGR